MWEMQKQNRLAGRVRRFCTETQQSQAEADEDRQGLNSNQDQLYPATPGQMWSDWAEPDHGRVSHHVYRGHYTHTEHTHTSCSKSIQVPLGQPLALCGLDIHILLCYILQPQQRSSRDWMLASLCQKAAVSSTILVFQKYGLPGRRGATGRAGRAEWHSWFPVLWADYCRLFPTAWLLLL